MIERNQTKHLGKRLWWWNSNPEHVYDFHKQEDIKLLNTHRNQKNVKGLPVLGRSCSMS